MTEAQTSASDPQQVADAAALERLRAERDADDLRAVLGTAEGRRVLQRLIFDWGGLHRASFRGEDTHATAFCEGQRSFATRLMAEIGATAPAAIPDLLAAPR